MGIEEVSEIISRIAAGFEEACVECMTEFGDVELQAIHEQLWSGRSGSGELLSPTYLTDPFFDLPGQWHKKGAAYMAWKKSITPPGSGYMLRLPPRPDDVPNLNITGKFYSEISLSRMGNEIEVDPGAGNGPDIVDKYGDEILTLGPEAVEYFNTNYLIPELELFYQTCGYR